MIGLNGSGKSNLLEAIAVLRATSGDLRTVISRGGGICEWIWKGAPQGTAVVEALVAYPDRPQPLRHQLVFGAEQHSLRLVDEWIENADPDITRFIKRVGTIEIGHHHEFPITSLIRAIDSGRGMVWESADDYPTFDAALADLDASLGEWLAEMGIEYTLLWQDL